MPAVAPGSSNEATFPTATLPAATLPTGAQATATQPTAAMDSDFIVRNQIVERYIGGRLPLKGAQEFERYCREHPELLEQIALTDRISAALRLLDASGQDAPWAQRPKPWWERLPLLLGVLGVALILGVACLLLASRLATSERALENLTQRALLQPLEPTQSTRPITVLPSRTGPVTRSMVTIGGGGAQMAALGIDMSWSSFNAFRVTIDRVDQGRVGVLHDIQRDSSGSVRIELNSSALGPGDYQFTIEGLTWRGEPVPQAWANIRFVH